MVTIYGLRMLTSAIRCSDMFGHIDELLCRTTAYNGNNWKETSIALAAAIRMEYRTIQLRIKYVLMWML